MADDNQRRFLTNMISILCVCCLSGVHAWSFTHTHINTHINTHMMRRLHSKSKSVAEEWYEAEKRVEQTLPGNPLLEDDINTDIDINTDDINKNNNNKTYVIIGGGWGGWGAAKTLCESLYDDATVNSHVILLDALPDPTGKTPYLSSSGKPVEAGTRGFWKDYPNINALCAQLGIEESDVFTEFTNSSFYSPDGLEATAPVFSSAQFPQLPSPLGQVCHELVVGYIFICMI